MKKNCWLILALVLLSGFGRAAGPTERRSSTLLEIKDAPANAGRRGLQPEVLDFRYSPHQWQVMINPPDDPLKSIVAWDGGLYYDFGKGGRFQSLVGDSYPWNKITWFPEYLPEKFQTRIQAELRADGEGTKFRQKWLDPRVPIVITEQDNGGLTLHQEAWAAAPREKTVDERSQRRVDYLWLKMENIVTQKVKGRIVVRVGVAGQLQLNEDHHRILKPDGTPFITTSPACESMKAGSVAGDYELLFPEKELAPGSRYEVLLGIYRGPQASAQTSVADAPREQRRAIKYWKDAGLPFDRMHVADPAAQALLDGSIRNFYQLRVIKNGLPMFAGGPSCYLDYWIFDSSLGIDAVLALGRFDEARDAIRYMLAYRQKNGSIQLMKDHWKETGVALWIITRYARLRGDQKWLTKMWPTIQGAVGFIQNLRAMTAPGSLNEGLMPAGFSDGGGAWARHGEYSNVYWNLVGLKATIEAARWLGKTEDAEKWQKEYDNFYAAFRRAAARDTKVDAQGNRFVPTEMGDTKAAPPSAQYGFVNAIFPGRVLSSNDPLVQSNMAMLAAAEREGIPLGVGWLKDGIWNIFGGFYAHAWLWLGDGQKAAATYYAFANHSCPLYAWVEEQSLVEAKPNTYADMPHQTGNIESIRLVRYMTIMEKGKELHLLEGLPHSWTKPGSEIRLKDVPTEFGAMSLAVTVAKDGSSATIQVDPPRRERPEKILVDLANFQRRVKTIALDGKTVATGPVQISTRRNFKLTVSFFDTRLGSRS